MADARPWRRKSKSTRKSTILMTPEAGSIRAAAEPTSALSCSATRAIPSSAPVTICLMARRVLVVQIAAGGALLAQWPGLDFPCGLRAFTAAIDVQIFGRFAG